MFTIFQHEGTDAVLLIDATNAFNCLNRAAALHNIQVTCPIIANYLVNTYRHPSKLLVAGGKVLLSMEGTTQGDPLAMSWYSLSTTIIINTLRRDFPSVSQVWLADDASSAGNLGQLLEWFKKLEIEGKGHGYYVNGKKSWLIVKSEEMAERARTVFGNTVNITSEGKIHLGAALGSEEYKQEYCTDMVNSWVKELTYLCQIVDTHPQSAYAAFTKGYRSKFTYFLRTIENFEQFLTQIDNLISEIFIPTIFGLETPLEEYRDVLSMNPKEGGLGLSILAQEAREQYKSSTNITQPHVESIIQLKSENMK